MRKSGKIIVWLLMMVLLCGQMPMQVFAQEAQYVQTMSDGDVSEDAVNSVISGNGMQTDIKNRISMQGENSFGVMLANELSTEMLEQQENSGCNICSVEIEEDAAIVSFASAEDAVLVIGIYDEAGEELLTSGSLDIFAGETSAVVEFESGSLPQYFYIKGYLVEPVTYRPLCTVYESPMYTREMQELLAKTTADFEEELVLNLDADDTNNFAVYGEDTILIYGDNGQNEVTMVDESNNIYVIEDADSSVTSLQPGDIIAYPYQENDVLIAKVASVSVDGTTVTIAGADTSMEEVFDYIKIDTEMGSEEAAVDASSCGDGVTYEGLVDYVEEDAPQTYSLEGEESTEKAFKHKLEKEFGGIDGINVKISGGLEMKMTFSAKVYLSFSQQYVELRFDYSAKVSASITGKASADIPLATVGFMPVAGVIVELTPTIVIDAQAAISVTGTLSGTVGFQVQTGVGITNLTTCPKFKTSLKAEGSIYIGFSLCPRIKILSEKVASASLTAAVGAEIKAELKEPLQQDEENRKHTCAICIAGEIYGKFNVSAELAFLNSMKFTITPADISHKAADFYYSADRDEFGFTTCPYDLLRGRVIVQDSDCNPIQNAEITVNGVTYATDGEGQAEIWLPEKDYSLLIEKEQFKTFQVVWTLRTGGECLRATLQEVNDGEENIQSEKVKQVCLGTGHSAALTETGDLYLWGSNFKGGLGDGTTNNSSIPQKIMGGVKEVSLGRNYSAAITEKGDLYLWGINDCGQLGDGTKNEIHHPKKIMSGVKEVSLGASHSAAITEEGDLYLWGYGSCGQLGDGTTKNSYLPKKIMSGVKEVSLGVYHSAAITEEGDLYLWGWNTYGGLGDGTTNNRSVPEKIMSGVKEVSLGESYSAAITEEGDLYLWGYNGNGRLGDGTTNNRSVPKKIMSGVKGVSLGDVHSAAITEEGDLYLWGHNVFGQLGDGTTKGEGRHPQKIMSGVKEVSLGRYHSAAITEGGDLYLWGANSSGQVGDGTTVDAVVPVKVDIMPTEKIVQVNLGQDIRAAITERGDLYLWGANTYGQLGDGTREDSSIPKKIMSGVKEVSLGHYRNYSAAITKKGDLYLWGYNCEGQLGDGTTEDSSIPKKVMSGVKEVKIDDYRSAAITERGDLYFWGGNYNGELGDGTTEDSSIPKKIMSGVKEVSLGRNYNAAITERGDLYLWGDNSYGQLGDGTTEASSIPKKIMSGVKEVSLGDYHSAALTEGGDLYLWGYNYYGQLGDGTTENCSAPQKIMDGIKEVWLGNQYSAALTEEGDLYLWGYNYYGQLGDGTKENSNIPKKIMSGVKEVSLGYNHSAALTEEGDLYLWGCNTYRQLGYYSFYSAISVPEKVMSGVKEVNLGCQASAAIMEGGCLYFWGAIRNYSSSYIESPRLISISPMTVTPTASSLYSVRNMSEDQSNEAMLFAGQVSHWNGTGFTDFLPNEVYNYYIMKDRDAEQPLAADNLLYIGQATADENGSMQVSCSAETAAKGKDIFAVSMHRMDLSEAEIIVDDLTYNGEEQYASVFVIYQDTLLEEGVDYTVSGDYSVTKVGNYTLTVEGIGLYEGTVSASYQMLSDGEHNVIAGTADSFGNETDNITLQLLDGNGDVTAETVITGNSTEYTLENILSGIYTLKVSKPNHVTREYTLTVGSEAVRKDVELYLTGDINGDGKVNAKDKKLLYSHIAGLAVLTDYNFMVGDINGDGQIDAADRKILYNHMAGLSLLW